MAMVFVPMWLGAVKGRFAPRTGLDDIVLVLSTLSYIGGIVLYVFFCISFACALRHILRFRKGRTAWSIVLTATSPLVAFGIVAATEARIAPLIAVIPFYINVPFPILDRRILRTEEETTCVES